MKTRRPRRVAEDIQQSKPFRTPHQEAAIALLRTADVVRRRISAVIERAGITGQQYNVLRIVRGAGEAGIPTLDIAKRMIERTPGITRLLDRLENRQLVRRERCPSDRRQVLCWITPAGLEVIAQLEKPVTQADKEVIQGLDVAELRHLIDYLDRIREEVVA
jgi:DNA-binding MarR family transcriptional regulator